MASVTRKKTSKYWYACYRLPDGRQKHVSTKTEDKHKALRIAHSLEGAVRDTSRGDFSRAKVNALVEEILTVAGAKHEAQIDTRSFIEAQWRGMRCSEELMERRKTLLDEFGEAVGYKIDRPPSEITSADVMHFRDRQQEKKLKSRTINIKLSALASAFKRAHANGEIPANPFFGVRVRSGDANEREPFSVKQVAKLLEETDGEWRVFIALAYYTGQRQQHVAKLRCDEIDLDTGVITFPPFKARRKPTIVPIHPKLEKILVDYGRVAPGDYLLPHIAGFDHRNISRAFRFQILPKIGLEQPRPESQKDGRVFAKWTFHSLRHSFVSHLADAGVNEAVRMAIVGHANKSTHLGYSHAEIESLRESLKKLG